MKKIIFSFFIIPFFAISQNYAVDQIPDSLKENANAVKRIDDRRLIIKSPSKAVLKHKWAYTILNEEGERFAYYYNYYDKFHDLSDISGTMFDATGKEIKSIKKRDIIDQSADDGFSLLTDARFKAFAFYNKNYPYTIEFEDEVSFDGLYSFPEWYPVNKSKLSVQNCSYAIEVPAEYTIRYKYNNCQAPIIKDEGRKKIYSWSLTNFKAFTTEPYQPEWYEVLPIVYTGVTEFEYGGYKGNMNSWKDYGLFQKELNKGKDELPDVVKQQLHNITDKLTTPHEKIEALYNYLQQNTRYISIQLGIGGLQPFEAKYVAQKKYGDCKALSNYMVAMLKEIGIKAHHAVIAAGEDETKSLVTDFPNHYFNHMICCVPLQKDTLWLECTSQTTSAGYMGNFTGNRKALLIADDGGYLVNTPRYKTQENQQKRKITGTISDDGTLTVTITSVFTGLEQETQSNLIHSYTQKQREEYLNRYINLPNYKVEKNEYKQVRGLIPQVQENLSITSNNYASVTGKRLFITPNVINKNAVKLSTDKPRKFDIEYDNAFIETDTVELAIPKGYTIESAAKNISIKNKFGEYSIEFKYENDVIKMLRRYIRWEGKYPATDYVELAKFYDDMYKADRAKMVFVKKE